MSAPKPMTWPAIFAILIATTLCAGFTLGLLGELTGFNPGAGIGAVTGVVAAFLIVRRGRALAAQNDAQRAQKPT